MPPKALRRAASPPFPVSFRISFDPIKQESVLAYELGTKQTLLSHSLQVDAAAFYYDYKDKQLIGYITTAFGNLPGLVSIPKSRVVERAGSLSKLPGRLSQRPAWSAVCPERRQAPDRVSL